MGYNSSSIPDTVKYIQSLGISTTRIEAYGKLQSSMAFYTPNILEKSEKNQVLMSVFDRMASERILFLTDEVNNYMSTIVQAQLMYLDSINNDDISLYVNSPGGSVLSGLIIYDTMNYVKSDVPTICTGMAASMGSIISSSGTKGKRYILPNGRFMLHQVSSGAQGHIDDITISLEEAKKYNDKLFQILADNTGKAKSKILKDSNRDLWLNAKESVEYGLCDEIITKKP